MRTHTHKLKTNFVHRHARFAFALRLPLLALVLASIFACPTTWADVKRSTLDERLVRSAESFENVIGSKTGAIPYSILAKAQGIIIFREYGAGFILGGKGGFGVAMQRQSDGHWGPPAFLSAGEGSFGLQIGVERQDLVFLFMSRDALKVFDKDKFKIGVDAMAAVGPVGENAEAQAGAPVLVYSDNTGLYAGATFEGGFLLPDNDANAKFYRREGIRVPEILRGEHVGFPQEAEALRRDLEQYESGQTKS
jgi:lipid-binding SYLF domain-containing protein